MPEVFSSTSYFNTMGTSNIDHIMASIKETAEDLNPELSEDELLKKWTG